MLEAPWVHPEHSDSALLTLVGKLPLSWLSQWHTIQGYIRQVVAPPLQISSTIFQLSTGSTSEDASCLRDFGFSKATWDQVKRLQRQYTAAEESR